MAITSTSGLAFDAFHFSPLEWAELLKQHGSPAELREASRCACWLESQGSGPDPGCQLCYPFGYLYAAPQSLKVFGPNRKPTRRIEAAGTFDAADAFFTFPPGIVPSIYSRLTLPLSILTVDDTLTRGKADILRFSRVLEVLEAHTSRRNPPTGKDYVVENVPLVAGTDYTINLTTGQVTWLTSAVPTGGKGRAVFHLRVIAEWILWEAQDRNEHEVQQPYRYLAKRLDYILRPKTPEQKF